MIFSFLSKFLKTLKIIDKNFFKNLLYSKPNLKLISEQAIILYQDLKLFSFDLKHPIKDFPERACIDKISVKLLPVDFNKIFHSFSICSFVNYDFYLSKNF